MRIFRLLLIRCLGYSSLQSQNFHFQDSHLEHFCRFQNLCDHAGGPRRRRWDFAVHPGIPPGGRASAFLRRPRRILGWLKSQSRQGGVRGWWC